MLVLETKGCLAGGQHPQLGQVVEQRRHQSGQRSRARVRSCPGAAPSPQRTSARCTAWSPPETWSVSATTWDSTALASTASRRTSHTGASCVSWWATSMASRVLPTPAGPTTVTRRCDATADDHLGDVDSPTDDRRRQPAARSPVTPSGARRRNSRWLSCCKTCCCSDCSSRTRLDAERLDQVSPHPRVSRECIGLPAGPVERRDQRGPEPLAQGVRLQQRLQLTDDLSTGTQFDPRGHDVLDQAESHLLQTRTVRRGPVTGVDEHVAAEQRQALQGPLERSRRVVGGPGRDARAGQLNHPPGVNGFAGHSEDVAVAGPHHQARVPQRTTQLGNLRVQRVRLRRLGPQSPPGWRRPAPAHLRRAPDGPAAAWSCRPAGPAVRRLGAPRLPQARPR